MQSHPRDCFSYLLFFLLVNDADSNLALQLERPYSYYKRLGREAILGRPTARASAHWMFLFFLLATGHYVSKMAQSCDITRR